MCDDDSTWSTEILNWRLPITRIHRYKVGVVHTEQGGRYFYAPLCINLRRKQPCRPPLPDRAEAENAARCLQSPIREDTWAHFLVVDEHNNVSSGVRFDASLRTLMIVCVVSTILLLPSSSASASP